MVSSRGWFVLAIAAVLGLFYVGHGLPISGNRGAFAQDAKSPTLIWQQVTNSKTTIRCERARVPGGWLVAAYEGENLDSSRHGIGLTFVPDPDNRWGDRGGRGDK